MGAAASIDGRAYVVGGCDRSWHEHGSLERFDPKVACWEVLASLAVPRWGLGAAALNSRLYALGGSEGALSIGACIGACERYCPEGAQGSPTSPRGSIGNWSFIGCLRLPRRLFGASATAGHRFRMDAGVLSYCVIPPRAEDLFCGL